MTTRNFLKFALPTIAVVAIVFLSFWHFWATLITLLAILNMVSGVIGAVLIFPKFFKRKMNMENIGIWLSIVLFGVIVLLVGIFHKPRYLSYY